MTPCNVVVQNYPLYVRPFRFTHLDIVPHKIFQFSSRVHQKLWTLLILPDFCHCCTGTRPHTQTHRRCTPDGSIWSFGIISLALRKFVRSSWTIGGRFLLGNRIPSSHWIRSHGGSGPAGAMRIVVAIVIGLISFMRSTWRTATICDFSYSFENHSRESSPGEVLPTILVSWSIVCGIEAAHWIILL